MENERWWHKICVEPVMFFYMLAYMITSVIEEAFFVHKVCRVNLNFTKEICDNISLPEYSEYNKQVQVKVASFLQWENVASHAIPVILAFFLGAWSDKVGRKLPLLLGLSGTLIFALGIVLNALMEDWPVEMVIYTASIPCALTGGNLTVFMASFSYLADTTTPKERTLRTTLLEFSYLVTMPTGVALGTYLFYNVFHRSYAMIFGANATLLVIAIIIAAVLVKPKRKTEPSRCCLFSLIDFNHVQASLKALLKPRREKRRMFLLLSLIAMALYGFQRGLLIGGTVLEKFVGLKDLTIVGIGAISHIITRIIFTTARVPYLFYVGAVIACLGPIVAPVLRSLVSKLVPSSDRGKVYALFTVADQTVPLISGFAYSQIYNATINTVPQTIFIFTAFTQFFILLIALFMSYKLKGTNVDQALDEERIKINESDSL